MLTPHFGSPRRIIVGALRMDPERYPTSHSARRGTAGEHGLSRGVVAVPRAWPYGWPIGLAPRGPRRAWTPRSSSPRATWCAPQHMACRAIREETARALAIAAIFDGARLGASASILTQRLRSGNDRSTCASAEAGRVREVAAAACATREGTGPPARIGFPLRILPSRPSTHSPLATSRARTASSPQCSGSRALQREATNISPACSAASLGMAYENAALNQSPHAAGPAPHCRRPGDGTNSALAATGVASINGISRRTARRRRRSSDDAAGARRRSHARGACATAAGSSTIGEANLLAATNRALGRARRLPLRRRCHASSSGAVRDIYARGASPATPTWSRHVCSARLHRRDRTRSASKRSCGRRRRWRSSSGCRAGSRTTSTTCSPSSPATDASSSPNRRTQGPEDLGQISERVDARQPR